MTTATKPKSAKQQHNDFQFGAVAAPTVASLWALFVAVVGRATQGIWPWLALVAAVVVAGCLYVAGRHRHVRPLSKVSLIYRSVVVMTVGVWLWSQLAAFHSYGLSSAQLGALAVAVAGLSGSLLWAGHARRARKLLRLAAPAGALLLLACVILLWAGQLLPVLHDMLAVTRPLPHGFTAVLKLVGYQAISLVVFAVPATILGVAFADRERTADEVAEAELRRNTPRSAGEQAMLMTKMLCRSTSEYTDLPPRAPGEDRRRRYHLSITDVTFWANGAGESYVAKLTGAKKGTTRDDLRPHMIKITTKLNLPEGCGIEVLPAKGANGKSLGQGYAQLDVNRVNVLEDDIFYPDLQPRSIMNAMPLGRTRSNREIGPFFRENSAYIWGQKGSGKTGVMRAIIAGALQCTDCLVWVIDLNAGNVCKDFLRGFKDGKVNRPCIDWVATTIEEVATMAQVALDIAVGRKKHYADMKFATDSDLMPIGNGGPGQPPPEILIVVDEGKTVLGAEGGTRGTEEGKAAAEAINQVQDLARDAAVNFAFSGLRITSDAADTSFVRGTSIRIGMQVTDDVELAHGFGDYSLSSSQIPYKGSGYIRCGNDAADVVVYKGYFLKPSRVAQVGIDTTPWRPYLDEYSLKVAGIEYANRWRRTAHHLWNDPRPEVIGYGGRPGTLPAPTGPAVQPTGQPAGTTTAVLGRPDYLPPTIADKNLAAGTVAPVGDSFEDMMRHARRIQDARGRVGGDPPAGGQTAVPPQDPPAGGGGEVSPDDPAPTPPAPPAAELTDDQVRDRFAELMEGVDVGVDPEAEPPSNSRDILERLVRLYGPIKSTEMYEKLTRGGDHGPAVKITWVQMYNLLKEPGTKDPVSWLVPRKGREPYDHRDRLSG